MPAVERVVAELTEQFGLSEWSVRVGQDSPPPGALAEVVVPEHTREATVHLSAEARGLPAERLRRVLAHELAHLLLWDVEGLARDTVARLDEAAAPVFDVAFTQQVELAVERLSALVCAGAPPQRHNV